MKILLTLSTLFAVLLTTLSAQTSHAQSVVTNDGPYSISTYKTKFGIGVSVYRGRETQPIDKISYTGDCKKYPTIQAILWPERAALKAFEASGNYDDLNVERLTEIFTRELSKQCPNVTSVRVGLGRGDRLVAATLSKASGWKNILGQISAEEAASPETKAFEKLVTTGRANTMLALMKNRKYADIRLRYASYYKGFHNQFLSIHSSMCTSHINDPVGIEVKSFKDVYDSNGFKIDSYESDKPYTITMDRKYADTFLKYKNASFLSGLGKILKAEADSRRDNPNAFGGEGVIAANIEVGADGERIRRFIAQGCKHTDVLSVYDKLGDVLPR